MMTSRICLGSLPTHLPQDNQRLGRATFLRPPIAGLLPGWSVAPKGSLSALDPAWARSRWYWNINQSSIAYVCRPRLRSRLTLGHTAEGFLPPLSLLVPAFSLPMRPRLGSPAASHASERSPTDPSTWTR